MSTVPFIPEPGSADTYLNGTFIVLLFITCVMYFRLQYFQHITCFVQYFTLNICFHIFYFLHIYYTFNIVTYLFTYSCTVTVVTISASLSFVGCLFIIVTYLWLKLTDQFHLKCVSSLPHSHPLIPCTTTH
jgi:hypothetical protein